MTAIGALSQRAISHGWLQPLRANRAILSEEIADDAAIRIRRDPLQSMPIYWTFIGQAAKGA